MATIFPQLHTERLQLRLPDYRDAANIQRLAGAVEIYRTTERMPHPYPEGAAERWIASLALDYLEDRGLVFGICLPEDGLVGTVGLRIHRPYRVGTLGYWIGVPYWGKGYVTEAARAMMDFGFGELDLVRIEARHFASNPASGRVMEKLGMHREGVLVSAVEKDGVRQDLVVHGKVRDDHV